MPYIGQSIPRLEALDKVTGSALYGGDLNRENQLHLKFLFSDRPHAIVSRLDTTTAEALPGVVAVFTARDVPVNEFGIMFPDQPVLCSPGSAKPYTDRVRNVGDQIAIAVAESESIAAEAVKLIRAEYEDLPLVIDPVQAMAQDSVLLYPDRESNVFAHFRIRSGDTDEGFQQAAAVIDAVYYTPAQEHMYLQTEAGMGYIDDAGRVTVEVGGQGAYEDRTQIAHALDLPEDQVRVIYPAVGGGFGGRGAITIQVALALAAYRLNERGIHRPVKTTWSREESMVGHCKRHPFRIRAKWGADADGRLVAAEMELIADGGAYWNVSDRVIGNAIQSCAGPYRIPNFKGDAYAVYTNNIPGGAFRGFGSIQAAVAVETQMNRLAEVLGIDPVEFRMRNLLREGERRAVGTAFPAGLNPGGVLETCAQRAGWSRGQDGWRTPRAGSLGAPDKPHLKRGLGIASGYKNVGFSYGMRDECSARIELIGSGEIEQAILYQIGAEIGQGHHTVQRQMAAEALGITPDKVQLVNSDTALAPDGGMAGASRLTFMAGNAIVGAARAALESWREEQRPAVGTFVYKAPKTTLFDQVDGHSEPSFAYAFASEAVAVEVDTETGVVKVLDVVCAEDVGKAINPRELRGQIEGAIIQGFGYGLMEDFRQESGLVQTTRLSTYLIPTVLDVPDDLDITMLEYPDPRGPWGARGAGEIAILPFVPALLAAIHDATGVWPNQIPLTPERLLSALREGPHD